MFFNSVPSISPADVSKVACNSKYAFIDVRTPDEYESGHAKCAVNIPLDTVQRDIDRLKSYSAVYVICQSGGRSASATRALQSGGVNAINVSGGTMAWRASGLPMA